MAKVVIEQTFALARAWDGTRCSARSIVPALPPGFAVYGDSQINGLGQGLTTSSWTAFKELYRTVVTAPSADAFFDAVGGRGLAGHRTAHEADWGASGAPRTGPEYVHIAESGGQDEAGQTTREQFGDTYEAYMRWINTRSPNAVISDELCYNFEPYDSSRDWIPYNAERVERAAVLLADGIRVNLIDTDTRIRALVADIGYNNVCYAPGHANQRHYLSAGNLMVGLAMIKDLGFDPLAADLSAVVAEGYVPESHIEACIAVISGT